MPVVEGKSDFERISTALLDCNMVMMDGMRATNTVKDGDRITIVFTDDEGEEYSTDFTRDTEFTIVDNTVTYQDSGDNFEVTLGFFKAAKYFI